MTPPYSYLMEHAEEAIRLEVKTDLEAVRKQADWCGVKPGLRVLDAGCGPGKVASILYKMTRPGGQVIGVDYSEGRIVYAKENYGNLEGIDFHLHDLRTPLEDFGLFDIVWVRFFLEYFREESADIVRNLSKCLKPGGYLCLIDLDHNCLSHYELPSRMEEVLFRLMKKIEAEFNFDPYVGRKLYAYLYDLGFKNIELELTAHHLIYGEIKGSDLFNWIKKVEMTSRKALEIFENYPGSHEGFFKDFKNFFLDPRRFTYTPLIMCKGIKPV